MGVKVCHPLRIAHHGFAVQGDGRASQRRKRLDDRGHFVRPFDGVAREDPHAVAIPPTDHAVPIVLDLMRPLLAFGHDVRERRKHGGDEAGRMK